MKLKKRKKFTRLRGTRFHGHSLNKKGKGKKGGKGLAGTGKRGDQKKGMVTKKYGVYFGKKGYKGRSREKKINLVMNLSDIEKKIRTLIIKGKAKKEKNSYVIELKKYKILGRGEIKTKIVVIAKYFSKTAKEKIEKAGGEIKAPTFNKDNNLSIEK